MAATVHTSAGGAIVVRTAARGDGEQLWYSLYGLKIRSDVPLPFPPITPGDQADSAACIFSRAEPGQLPPEPDGPLVTEIHCDAPCHNGAMIVRVHRGRSGTWIWNPGIGTCHVAPGARQVLVYPEPGADERALGLMLLGQVSSFIMHQLGYLSLHASAVVTKHGAVAFLGRPCQGKSTMAACFLRHGAQLLTDDILPLRERDDGVYGFPGPPIMKLWSETAECTLRLSEPLPNLTATLEKKLLTLDHRYGLAQEPGRLRGLYIIRRYKAIPDEPPEIQVTTMNARDSLRVLLAQTMRAEFLYPTEIGRLLPLYSRLIAQAPVRVLHFPNGFEYQEAVYAGVLENLKTP